ncbi:MAG: YifB family Mg chelatase-like AAA ATPase [Phycisphaerae bacterium]|nr:YifB family Mg chelatase-like AAA ATPase [Phycisphaerae bacterium]
MLAKVHSFVLQGIDAIRCEVEVNLAPREYGDPLIVGLADKAVSESLDRIHTAMVNSGYRFPQERLLVNLAPADIKKEGSALELPIALGVLHAAKVVQGDNYKKYLVAGELALDGSVRPIKGALSMAMLAAECKLAGILLPTANAREAAVVPDIDVYAIDSLTTLVGFLNGQLPLESEQVDEAEANPAEASGDVDFADVRGQELAKRALTIAAAGRHNLLLLGPPGAGKTMLCQRLPTILPPLTRQEALETSRVYSACGLLPRGASLLRIRPVRMPHHTASGAALIGGGSIPRPGEVSLAHHGVLFLDELPEFSRHVLEMLRQPLESGMVTIARSHSSVSFPARFMLVAAMNPSASGKGTLDRRNAKATELAAMDRYMSKLSGPLLDRIDIHLEVPAVTYRDLTSKATGTSSAQMRAQVENARRVQAKRFGDDGTMSNAAMKTAQLKDFCALDETSLLLMKQAMEELGLSARAFDKVRRVARTIADLEGQQTITPSHVTEAIGYRLLDRKY